jgi:Tol biopolymer transport system component
MGLAPGEEKERELSWFDWSLPCDLSADGKMLVFTEIFEGGGPFGAVYLRKTDGSPAVRLGEGEGLSLSPDGKWVIAVVAPGGKAPPRLTLLPTGPGVTQTLEIGRFEGFGGADWLPDGRRILFSAKEAGRRVRVYVHDIAGGKPRATTPEGITLRRFGNAISPDGKSFVAYRESGQPTIHPEQAGGPSLYPTEGGGQPRPIPGMTGGDTQIQWAADGRAIYVYRRSMPVRAKVWLLDVDTGEKKLWKEIRPADTSISSIRDVVVSPDGKSYAYRSSRSVSELYLVEGLR